jgi:ribosomal protein S18 acetylase RimI-like enzyme
MNHAGVIAAPVSENSAVEVRHTSVSDWCVLKALRLAALADAPTAFGVSLADAAANPDAQWMTRAAGKGPGRFYLAWQDGHAIGMAASVRSEADRAASTAGLIAMWVAPQARGSGAASLLVETIQAALRAEGVGTLLLEVAPDNARAVAFYQRHGFAFQAHRERLASHPHIEVQRMACPLHAPA